MKKLSLIILLFCLSLIAIRAEEIKDPDFEQFFANFQKDFAQRNVAAIRDLISTNYMLQHSQDANCSIQIIMGIQYYSLLRQNTDKVLKLSPKNHYTVGTKRTKGPYSYWDLYKIDTEYARELYGLDKAYHLACVSEENEFGGSTWCVFGKIPTSGGKHEWRIIDFGGAG